MSTRFFVQVEAPDRAALQRLIELGVDVVHGTFRPSRGDTWTVQGLVHPDELEGLVDAGFRVTVESTAQSRSRARETVTFDEWLAGMEDDPVVGG